MSISCGCYDDDWEFMYFPPKDFSVLETKRGRRCWSCGILIKVGEDCGLFLRERGPRTEIEERIYGEDCTDIPMADKYMCEECTGLYFTLEDMGFCITLPSDMREDIKMAGEALASQ